MGVLMLVAKLGVSGMPRRLRVTCACALCQTGTLTTAVSRTGAQPRLHLPFHPFVPAIAIGFGPQSLHPTILDKRLTAASPSCVYALLAVGCEFSPGSHLRPVI